ncbi:hypothetical protein ACFFRR_007525 [Megaselia abdita]
MKVLQSLLLIAIFAFLAVSAFPRKEHVHKTLEHAKNALRKQVGEVVDWLENHLDGSRQSNGCTDDYQRKVDNIFNDTSKDIDRCLLEGENTFFEIESHMRVNREQILYQQNNLQQSLDRCANLNGTDFFECYVENFDANLYQLDQISTVSQQTLIEYQRNQSNTELVLEGCVNLAVMGAKTQTTLAYNEFQKCIQDQGIPSITTPAPGNNGSTPSWNETTTLNFTTPAWNETTLNYTTPAWNETTLNFTTPAWNETTLNYTTPAWNETTLNFTTPAWNETTLNFTTPAWNETTLNFTTPAWNETTLNFTTPAWNETTLNFTTPAWNETTLNYTTPAWNETTLNFTTPAWNETTLNFTTPAWNETTLNFTTPDWNETTLNFTTPAWNTTTLNFTTPAWNETTLNFTTPAWNETTLWNSTTPLFNSTASVNTTSEAPEETTTPNVIEKAESAVQNWLNHIWGSLHDN